MPRMRAVFGLAVAICLLWAGTARAAVFTVNSKGDKTDASTADGVCDTSAALNGLQCSLRAAIQQANSTSSDADIIQFDIPGTGVQRIRPSTGLPNIAQPVTINGYSQPGSSANTTGAGTNAHILIDLDGSNATGGADGLTIAGGNTTVRGLVINNFQDGLSGDGFGIFLLNLAPNTGNVIRGNFIGTNPAGTAAEANDGSGIAMFSQSTGNSVGGSTAASPNLVSGNRGNGITLDSSSNTAQRNLVGTDRAGTADLGNHGNGFVISGGSNNTLINNTVGFNFGAGVDVFSGTGNLIGGNSIFFNDGLGIDLGANGRTPNDGGASDDADSGANNLQNFPSLTSAATSSTTGDTTVSVLLDTAPNQDYDIRLFRNPPGTSQGKTFLETQTVHTDSSGFFGALLTLTKTVPTGETLTATATDPSSNTSEFSDPRLVRSAP